MIRYEIYPKNLSDDNVIVPNQRITEQLFEVTYLGMLSVFPTIIQKDNDYELWLQGFTQRIRTGTKYIVIFTDEIIKGYIAYKIRYDKQDINVEDLIIHPRYQSDGRTLMRLLYIFFKATEDININAIRGHTNKLNLRMQGLLSKLGFSIEEYTESGIRYITTKEHLMMKLSKIFSYLNNMDADLYM